MLAYMGLVNSTLSASRASLPLVGRGSFEVGCADIMVEAQSEEDVGVFARIFYPAVRKTEPNIQVSSSVENHSWRPRKEYIDGLAAYKNISPRKLQIVFDILVGGPRLPCDFHRPISLEAQDPTCSSFPVVIYSHGLSSCRLFSSSYCASLASYGFVVAAIEHRDRSACWTYKLERKNSNNEILERPIPIRKLSSSDNEFRVRNGQLHRRVTECVKLFNVLEELNMGNYLRENDGISNGKIIFGKDFDWSQLKGRLDMSRTAIAGHSFGGATAISACAFSTEFRSAVVLDGWMFPIERDLYPRALQPTLFLNADRFQWPENVRSMMRVGDNSSKNFLFTFRGITHYAFTDLPLVVPGFFGRKIGLLGNTDSVRCLEALVETSVHFLKESFGGNEADFSTFKTNYSEFLVEGSLFDFEKPSAVTL